jgi:ribosomal protein S18 acetylase RimI-like enzyme
MGSEAYSLLDVTIRPLAAADVPACHRLAAAALGGEPEGDRERAARAARGRARMRRLLATDPRGCWVAEARGELLGVALALVREGVWGLSLLAVAPGHQGRGIGRRLLDAALASADGTRGAIILSSSDPKAMRRYARAGFDLRPCVAAAGIVRPERLAPAAGLREGEAALAAADAISRAVRGAAHGDDLRFLLECDRTRPGRALALGDRAYAVHVDGTPVVLAARDDDAAATVLRGALLAAPPGGSVDVDFIAAGNDWAVRTCLDAGLALSPCGPVFTRGDVGPMRPYLPSGSFL